MATKQEEFNAFLEAQEVEGYKLGDIEGTPEADMIKYTELKIGVKQEAAKLEAFNKVWDLKFQELSEEQDAARIALGKEKQTAQDLL